MTRYSSRSLFLDYYSAGVFRLQVTMLRFVEANFCNWSVKALLGFLVSIYLHWYFPTWVIKSFSLPLIFTLQWWWSLHLFLQLFGGRLTLTPIWPLIDFSAYCRSAYRCHLCQIDFRGWVKKPFKRISIKCEDIGWCLNSPRNRSLCGWVSHAVSGRFQVCYQRWDSVNQSSFFFHLSLWILGLVIFRECVSPFLAECRTILYFPPCLTPLLFDL